MAIIPINRWTEKEDNTYRVYNNMSPHYYVDATGSLNPIDITNIQTITKDSVGEIKLREKNIASVGLRTDGNKTKYLGIRPDETQEDGTQQLEWTIEEAIINNSNQSITLNQTTSIDDVTTNLGGQVVQSTRHFTRQMVPVTGNISNFQVKYKLHLTGLQISNNKYTENTIVRNDISSSGAITVGTSHYVPFSGYFKITDTDGNVKFLISLPVLLDSNFEQVLNYETINDTTHTLKDNDDGTYEYIKYPSDDSLINGISGSVKYIDATTIYSSTGDGCINLFNWGSQDFDADHDATGESGGGYGWFVRATHDSSTVAVRARPSLFFLNQTHLFGRSHYFFDTSGISDTPAAATFNITHITADPTQNIIAIESTATDPITSHSFSEFTGYESGWDGDAGDTELVPYSAMVGTASMGGVEEKTEIPLIAAGLAAIASNDTTKICLMEYDMDFKDVDPGNGNDISLTMGVYYSDNDGTDKDPYLEITAEAAEVVSHPQIFKILSGHSKVLSGEFIIK